jgi:hypothetical protein
MVWGGGLIELFSDRYIYILLVRGFAFDDGVCVTF